MAANDHGQLPSYLARGLSRFLAWRWTRQAGCRIPPVLWEIATGLARTHGVSRTAIVLGLDYYSLRKRVEEAVAKPRSETPSFLELPSPIVLGKECRLELDNGAGTTMRVHLVGYDTVDVEALSRSFWGAL